MEASQRVTSDFRAMLFIFGAGMLTALQGRTNGALGDDMRSGLAATTVSFIVGLLALSVLVAVSGRRRQGLRVLFKGPSRWWWWLGGLGGAASSAALTVGSSRVGVSLTLIGLAAGLTAGGIFSDRVGLGPGGRRRITTTRALGVAMALGAVALTASAKPSGKFDALVIAELVGGGFATACQQGVNGRLGRLAGNAIVAAMISFAVGTVALVALTAGTVRHYFWSAPWWLYLGGLLAAIFVVVSASVVGRLGVLRVMLGTVGGQLSGGVLLDAVAPPAGVRLTAATVAGAAIAIIAVGLAGAGADSPRAKIDPARASVPAQGLGGPS